MNRARTSPRNYFRISLRLLLILITLAALATAYPASFVRQSAYERAIVANLPKRSRHVEWTPIGPKWLRDLVGEERCQAVKRIRIHGVIPRNLEQLRELSALEDLVITECDLGDAHVKRIGPLPKVRSLNLRRTSITDRSVETLLEYPLLDQGQFERTQLSPAGIKRLYEDGRIAFFGQWHDGEPWTVYLPNRELVAAGFFAIGSPAMNGEFPEAVPEDLFADPARHSFRLVGYGYRDHYLELHPLPDSTEALALDTTAITAKGMVHIANLQNLKSLSLNNNDDLDDDALAALAGHPQLERLIISERNITAEGLRQLCSIPNLRELYLNSPGVRNAAITAISDCKKLEYLNLHSQNITSDCLPALCQLTSLKELSLGGTSISNRHIDDLVKLERLNRLNLSSTFVNANGARQLLPLKQLAHLELGGEWARFTRRDRDQLKAAKPRCVMHFE